ncbi:hypothetical protein A1OO_15855 [Enterovibrio norvegicus FF-33]|nr:hypothetical protein A1OO_15855 [Enterovibrio norvegicus FF-33]
MRHRYQLHQIEKILSINPSDGIVTQLSNFSDMVRFGEFSSWGDFYSLRVNFYENAHLKTKKPVSNRCQAFRYSAFNVHFCC